MRRRDQLKIMVRRKESPKQTRSRKRRMKLFKMIKPFQNKTALRKRMELKMIE